MMSLLFYGCVWGADDVILFFGHVRDALGERPETQQEHVTLILFGFAEFIIGAMKPV